ncbi:hypothetical protein EV424DRAFT_993598 [Suillus variegatus]|nr:hypothetical protein EV424DRAFT_993598 [Suillus variegatus]
MLRRMFVPADAVGTTADGVVGDPGLDLQVLYTLSVSGEVDYPDITEPVIQRDEKAVALTTRVRIASPAKWSVPSNAELASLRGTLNIVSMANDEDSGTSLWYWDIVEQWSCAARGEMDMTDAATVTDMNVKRACHSGVLGAAKCRNLTRDPLFVGLHKRSKGYFRPAVKGRCQRRQRPVFSMPAGLYDMCNKTRDVSCRHAGASKYSS